ncbi:MAG: hypothetical protein K1V99_02995 [Bacteroidales bacterium]
MTEEEKLLIEEQIKHNRVVFQTIEGLQSADIEEFCKQDVDFLLYDLNRDEATTSTLNNERAINDIAVAKVIRYLHKKAFGK